METQGSDGLELVLDSTKDLGSNFDWCLHKS